MEPTVADGFPQRDYVEYDHPEGLFTIEAHRVTEDTAGDVTVAGNTTQRANVGDVIIKRDRVHEVHAGTVFDEWGLIPTRGQRALEQLTVTEVEAEKEFDPTEHTAAEVRRYLRNPELGAEEKDRVETAEREGKNRPSAFPQ